MTGPQSTDLDLAAIRARVGIHGIVSGDTVLRLCDEVLQAQHERDCAVESLAAADRLLRKYLDREFNPFEPNNQSATYKELSAFLYPTSPADVTQNPMEKS